MSTTEPGKEPVQEPQKLDNELAQEQLDEVAGGRKAGEGQKDYLGVTPSP